MRRSLRASLLLTDRGLSALAGVAALLGCGAIFALAVKHQLKTDFPRELTFGASGLHTGVFPGNFLLYVLEDLFGGLSDQPAHLKFGLVTVLALAMAAKVGFSVRFALAESTQPPRVELSSIARVTLALGVVLCSVAFSLPGTNYYLGQVPPNVWHNATTILAMPFALGLFWASLTYLRTPAWRWLWWTLALAALNMAAKPSFVSCFLVVFPLAALLRFRASAATWRAWGATAAVAVLLGVQYLYVYILAPAGSRIGTSNGVSVQPLKVWDYFLTPNPDPVWPSVGSAPAAIVVAFLSSYTFAILALSVCGPAIRANRAVRYAVALAAVGLLEFALLAEQGTAYTYGNFLWAAVTTHYLLLLTTASAVWLTIRAQGWTVGRALTVVMFAVTVVTGVVYLIHWFATGSYF